MQLRQLVAIFFPAFISSICLPCAPRPLFFFNYCLCPAPLKSLAGTLCTWSTLPAPRGLWSLEEVWCLGACHSRPLWQSRAAQHTAASRISESLTAGMARTARCRCRPTLCLGVSLSLFFFHSPEQQNEHCWQQKQSVQPWGCMCLCERLLIAWI